MIAPKVTEATEKAAQRSGSRLEDQQQGGVRRRPEQSAVDEILRLQRTIGNQATIRLLRQRAASSAEKDHTNYDVPVSPVHRKPPPLLQAKRPALRVKPAESSPDEQKADCLVEDENRHIPIEGVIQRTRVPGAPPGTADPRPARAKPGGIGSPGKLPTSDIDDEYDRLEREVAGSATKPAPPDKLRARLISALQARRRTEVDDKLIALNNDKTWRADYHANIEERWRVIKEANEGYVEAQKEFDEATSGFYIFEHESTERTKEKLEKLREWILKAGEETRNMRDSEKTYEEDEYKTEKNLLREQSSISLATLKSGEVGATVTRGDFESMAKRIDQLSRAVDDLRDMELKAQVRFTGSGPGSRP